MTPLTEQQSKYIRELLRSARSRREHGEFVIEGPHLLEVALEKAPLLFSFCAVTATASEEYTRLIERAQAAGIKVYSLSSKLANRISDTEEPQGIFAVLKIPPPTKRKSNIILALDAIQDPGNVGTILRTAAWFGIQTILLGEGTADVYAPKVVRSTQGAIFEVSAESNVNLRESLLELKKETWQIIATTLSHSSKSIYEFDFRGKCVILLGSEARGISEELLKIADQRIIIPRFGTGESLNVASSAAIILSEARRRG